MRNKDQKRLKLADEEPVFLLFYNARSFHVTASKLEKVAEESELRKVPLTDFFLWPTIVCEAFALELHLKCLLTLRNKTFDDIHENKELFEILDDDDKDLVRRNFDELISIDPLLSVKRAEGSLAVDLEDALRRGNRMFVRARYWHEGIPLAAIENDEMCTAGICSLSNALATIILDIRPDWTEEKMKSVRLHRKSYFQPPT